jgi:hypothetical protein
MRGIALLQLHFMIMSASSKLRGSSLEKGDMPPVHYNSVEQVQGWLKKRMPGYIICGAAVCSNGTGKYNGSWVFSIEVATEAGLVPDPKNLTEFIGHIDTCVGGRAEISSCICATYGVGEMAGPRWYVVLKPK